MLDFLYSLGQALCLLGLAYGALLAMGNSKTFTARREARNPHRRQKDRSKRDADGQDPPSTDSWHARI
jgi:hypothetical protein